MPYLSTVRSALTQYLWLLPALALSAENPIDPTLSQHGPAQDPIVPAVDLPTPQLTGTQASLDQNSQSQDANPTPANAQSADEGEPAGAALLAPPVAEPSPSPVLTSPTTSQDSGELSPQELEFRRLQSLLAENTAVQTEEAVIRPIISDIPKGPSPFEEITAFGLPLTGPTSKVHFGANLTLGGIFDSNINLDSSHKQADFITAVSPAFALSLGTDDSQLQLLATYAPTFLFFAHDTSQNTVDQNATAILRYALPKLTLGLHLAFEDVTGANVDVGDRVRMQTYYAGITSDYAYDDKLSFSLNSDETVSNYNGLLNSSEMRVESAVNYQATGKTQIGLGTTFGILDVESGPTQTYDQLQLLLNYEATGKLLLHLNLGVEFRDADGLTVAPIFGIGAVYSPFATTTVSLDIYRRTYASAALADQNYNTTGILANINQQLCTSFSLDLTAGYEYSNYYAVRTDVPSNRTDNYFFFRFGPDWQVSRCVHLVSFYEFSADDSNGIGGRSFTRNRVGIQANINF